MMTKKKKNCRGMAGGLGGTTNRPPGMPVVPQSQNAKLFDGQPEREGWEETVYFHTAIATIMIIIGLNFTPETSMNTWARNEAAARLILKEEHGFTDFEFGKHYQDEIKKRRPEEWDKLGSKFSPFKDEDDDDEDEDDEEEDE